MLSGSLPKDAANNPTNTRLLFIAAFVVVEHTKFSPDTHIHTLSLSNAVVPWQLIQTIFFSETLKFSKNSFSQRTNFFVKGMKNILKYLAIFYFSK
jgi:hypothetical protein